MLKIWSNYIFFSFSCLLKTTVCRLSNVILKDREYQGVPHLSRKGVGEKLGTLGLVKGCPESSDLADMDKNSPLWIFPATLLGPQASMRA